MTVEAWTQTPEYTIAGIGPYAITHPYVAGAIRARVRLETGLLQDLISTEYSVTPEASAIEGDLFLSPSAATTHAGRQLIIDRVTPDEQGFLAVLGEREAGLAAQLDRMVQANQEIRAQVGGALRIRGTLDAFELDDGTVPIRDGDRIRSGPTAAQIAAAQSNAVDAEASRDAAASSAAQAALYDGPWLQDVAALLADTSLVYGPGASGVEADDIVRTRADGFAYQVAPSNTSDQHITTAGGVKLYVLPAGGVYAADAFGLSGDAATDDTTPMQVAVTAAAGKTLRFSRGKTYLTFGVVVQADTTIDLNGATIRHRPTTGSDSDNFSTFSGTAGIYGTDKKYPCFFYIKGGFRLLGNGGTIDGNTRAESATYRAGINGFDFAHGGSHAGSVDRSGIAGTALDGAKPYLEVSGVNWMDMYGEAVSVEGCPDIAIRDCVETNGHSLFCNVTGAVEATATSAGSLIFSGNRLHGTRQYNRVPNDLVVGNFDTCSFANNIVDGRDKLTSTTPEGSIGTPDAGKFQSINDLVVSGNLFHASGIKLASYAGFVGESINVTGNQFVFPDAVVFNGGGIVGGGAPYANTAIVGNTFLNSHLAGLELPTEAMLIADNVFTATSSRLATTLRPEWAAIYINNNRAVTPGRTFIRGNTFNLGGFNGHVMLFGGTPFGDLRIVGNEITGCDHVHVTQTPFGSASMRMEWSGNRIWGNRTMGRFRFNSIAELSFVGNEIGAMDTTAPTTISGYASVEMRIALNSGVDTWGLVRFARNFVNDTTNTFRVRNDTTAGVTISAFLLTDNVWLSNFGAAELISMLSANAATVPLVVVKNNVFGGDIRLSNVWTITNEIISGNTFLAPGDVVFNSGGNVALTGDRATTVGAAGTAAALPAAPTGYLNIDVDGAIRKVPFYNA